MFGPEQREGAGAGESQLSPREALELARKREAAEAVFTALWKAQEAATAAAQASGAAADRAVLILHITRVFLFAEGLFSCVILAGPSDIVPRNPPASKQAAMPVDGGSRKHRQPVACMWVWTRPHPCMVH